MGQYSGFNTTRLVHKKHQPILRKIPGYSTDIDPTIHSHFSEKCEPYPILYSFSFILQELDPGAQFSLFSDYEPNTNDILLGALDAYNAIFNQKFTPYNCEPVIKYFNLSHIFEHNDNDSNDSDNDYYSDENDSVS